MHKSTLETHHQPIMPVLALVLATFFWGSSFITVGSALALVRHTCIVQCHASGMLSLRLATKARRASSTPSSRGGAS